MVGVEAKNEKTWQRHMMMEIWCLVVDEYASVLSELEQPEKATKMRKLVQGAYTELRDGSYFSQTWRVIVGRSATT